MGQHSHYGSRTHCALLVLALAAVCLGQRAADGAFPDASIVFATQPRVSVESLATNTSRTADLVGMTPTEVIVRATGGSVFRVPNNDIKQLRTTDGGFTYLPGDETLKDFLQRVQSDTPDFVAKYGVTFQDASLARVVAASATSSTGATNSRVAGRPPVVPSTSYQSDRPWEQVALLNPPRVIRKAQPAAPPPRPPAVAQPEQQSGGIPTWGKFAIAAVGVAGLFVLVKK